MNNTWKFNKYPETKPSEGEDVLWVWDMAGLVISGDFANGAPRDANDYYKRIEGVQPSHWVKFPTNWPKGGEHPSRALRWEGNEVVRGGKK